MNHGVAIGLVAGGGFFALAGLVLIGQTLLFLRKAVPAEGTVVGHHARTDHEHVTWFRPKVVFHDRAGKQWEVIIEQVGTKTSPEFKEGKTLRVLYDPSNPKHARTTYWYDLWRGLVPLIVGLGCLIAGITAFWTPN